jgi:polar amino acid transport system substrate-binding protein
VVKGFPSQPESLLALKGGTCVVAVHTGATVALMLEDRADEWKECGILIPTEIVPADSVVWIRKGEKDTAAALDKALRELIASGRLLEIARANRLLNTAFIEEQQKALSAAR